MSSPAKTQVHNIIPIGEDGIIRCYCNEPAPLRTSRTIANPNRDFYVCSKDRDDQNRCKFYKWKDELDGLTQPPTPSQARTPSQPTPSQRMRADITHGSMTPSPQKQGYPSEAALAQPKVDAGRQQRLADIEAGLASTSENYSPPQTVNGSDDDDVFHSTISSPPRSTHYHIHLPPAETPRSPKRPRLERDGSRNSSMLMTPPRSDGSELRGAFMGAPPESPSLGKRKAREGEESDVSQWQSIMEDQGHPYHERVASLRGAFESVSHQTLPSSSQNTVVASTTTPESIKTLISDLSSTLPSYIAKLERKQLASEKSNEAKVKRIEELERENVLLRNKARVLEETVSALKARRPPS